MKKYKIKPYQSYYRYKKRKLMIARLFVTTVIISLIGLVVWIKEGTNFIDPPQLIQKELETMEEVVAEPVYFNQQDTLYNVHNEPPEIKAVYLPAGYMKKTDAIIELANTTEVNAVVVDIKDDFGYLTFRSDNERLQEMVKQKPPIDDIRLLMGKLYENNIYPIARIVSFKDEVVGKTNPERLVKRKDGTIFETSKGETWLDPYNKDNWDYLLEICNEAIKFGFKEIQFDYVRFHESMSQEICDFPSDQSKVEIITEFVEYMYGHLHEKGIVVSADVFGTIITSKIDAEIVGQDYKELMKHLDYICPMIYPSHYGPGSFGVKYPDLDPYSIILSALQYSNNIMKEIPREERRAKVRPWLQDFTASWVNPHQIYGPAELRSQIDACHDALTNEWILWNAAANYSEGGLERK